MAAPDLTGKTAIITGGAGGIGRVLARALHEAGANVVVADIDAGGVAAVQSALGDRALGIQTDVADPRACEAAVERTVERFGSVHILINNAALGMSLVRRDHMTRTVQIEDIPVETWQRFFASNLTGAFCMAKAAVPRFRAQRWGRIVNVTTSFFTMLRGGFSPYGPAKAALEAWSASLAKELKGSGITVNVVVPGGPADTPMVPKESGMDRHTLIPPAVMAPPILWLCSPAGDGVTGMRYVAANWDTMQTAEVAATQAGAPAAWPELAHAPVWPGGRPADG